MIKVALIGIGGMGGCHFECYKNIKNAVLEECVSKEKLDRKIEIFVLKYYLEEKFGITFVPRNENSIV